MNPEMKPYNVVVGYLTPVEARLVIDATSEDHAREIANAILAERYKEPKVFHVYEFDVEEMHPSEDMGKMNPPKGLN